MCSLFCFFFVDFCLVLAMIADSFVAFSGFAALRRRVSFEAVLLCFLIRSEAVLPFNLLRIAQHHNQLKVFASNYARIQAAWQNRGNFVFGKYFEFGGRILQLRQTAVHNSLFTVQAAIHYHLKMAMYLFTRIFHEKNTHGEKCGLNFCRFTKCGFKRVPCKTCEIKYLTNEDRLNKFWGCWLSRWTKREKSNREAGLLRRLKTESGCWMNSSAFCLHENPKN